LDSNIEGLKNEYEFKLEIRSSQIRTSFNNPRSDNKGDSKSRWMGGENDRENDREVSVEDESMLELAAKT